MEGYGHNHYFVFLADASISRERAGLSADEVHRGVVGIASLYSEVLAAQLDRANVDQAGDVSGDGGCGRIARIGIAPLRIYTSCKNAYPEAGQPVNVDQRRIDVKTG